MRNVWIQTRTLTLQEFSLLLHFLHVWPYTLHVPLHAVQRKIIHLCFSSSFSPSAVWMYGFTDSPRKEASGSFVHPCQHVECGRMPVLLWAQRSWCTVLLCLYSFLSHRPYCKHQRRCQPVAVCRCHILLLPIQGPSIYVSEWSELSGPIFFVAGVCKHTCLTASES